MNKLHLIFALFICSCGDVGSGHNYASEWKTPILEPHFIKTLEKFHELDSLNLTGPVDWHNLKQQPIVETDLWNLYDAVLIDSMIIFDSITILAREYTSISSNNADWYLFTTSPESWEGKFKEQEKNKVIDENWIIYYDKPTLIEQL